MEIEELEKNLQNKELDSIYVLYGEEIFLLETILKKIKKKFGELIQGINYITINETNIEELIPNIETPAFGYEKKLILIKNTGLLKSEGKKKNILINDQKNNIAQYVKDNLNIVKETAVLIFIEDTVEQKELFKILDENGIVCNFKKQTVSQVAKRIKTICNLYKVNIKDDVLRYFIETCGINMQELINEIRKLIEYTGQGGEITKDNIDNISIKQIDAIIFDLTDNLGKKDITKALETYHNLIYSKEPVQKILITLYNHFKKLYITKLSIIQKKDLVLLLELKPNQTFLVNKYKAQSKYFEENELRQILKELINLDGNSKQGLIDVEIGLESILCTYCS